MSSSIPTTAGPKPVDPYKAKNYDPNAPVQEKIEDLVKFIKDIKYGMLTTKASDSELLSSRAMALAGTVCLSILSPPSHATMFLISGANIYCSTFAL